MTRITEALGSPEADPLHALGDECLESGVCAHLTYDLLRETDEVVRHTMVAAGLSPPTVSLLIVGSHPAAKVDPAGLGMIRNLFKVNTLEL